MNRRKFIETSGAVAGGAMLGTVANSEKWQDKTWIILYILWWSVVSGTSALF